MTNPLPPDWTEEFDEREWLLHRFIDGDLEPGERLRFLELLDQDPQLRRELLDMERLLGEAGSLPRFTPPPDLAAQVLKQIKPSSGGMITMVKEMLWAPRVLHWNPAMALLAASIVLALAWVVNQRAITSGPISPSIETSNRAPAGAVTPVAQVVPTPDTEEALVVRLVLIQPEARSVSVAGDFNSWMPDRTPLRETEKGVWTATLHVKPGRYHYMFVIDGEKWVPDPLAGEYSLDGFGSKNSVLDVATTL